MEIILWYHAVETLCRYKTLNAVFILEDIFILEGVFILGAHAQRGLLYLVYVSVCVCVCVSVSTYSLPTGTKPAHQRYQWL